MLWLITPVWKRLRLTEICLRQRARMIEDCGARAVIVGDDESIDVARELGLDVVVAPNDYLGRKFNAGYLYALEQGATHCMAIGSDSWMHPRALDVVEWDDQHGYALVGLSSFQEYGEERIDMGVKHPAGFGVGMVYPAFALRRYPEGPVYQFKRDGIDASTWARCGRARMMLKSYDLPPYHFTNFHSPDESITDYRLLRHQRINQKVKDDVFGVLRGLYDDDLVDDLEALMEERRASRDGRPARLPA